jgi:site-specific DNA-methyltransferase (adenine-specific)
VEAHPELVMTTRILHGDCLEMMPTLDTDSVDAIVSDPPYGLGFMGKEWDHGVPGVDFWREALRVAKPGAHLVAFGGTRTYHRLTCAIEDAGWEIRDCLSWLYGSGFPKSHNGPWGGTALKPAWEPIILARKPLAGTVAANVAAHGTGALNIDGCRIGAELLPATLRGVSRIGTFEGANGNITPERIGRWPANVVLDEDAVAMLDAQTGVLPAGGFPAVRNTSGYSGGLEQGATPHGARTTDSGGASRFFYCAKASRGEREAGLEGMPTVRVGALNLRTDAHAEASGNLTAPARNHHPTVKPIALMRWLCRLVTPPGGVVLDPFTGSGTTGCAAVLEGFHFVGIEREAEYVEIARRRVTHWAAQRPAQADAFEGVA